MEAALKLLADSEPLHRLLGERFVQGYIAVKRTEYEIFFRVISSWEREFLLLNV
jgi:glutamine synthetase